MISTPLSVLGRAAAVLTLAIIIAVGGAGAADAHAYLDHSNPADGATVTEAPRTLRLAFSEHVVLSASKVQLFDAEDRSIPLSGLRLVTDDPEDTEEPAQIVADLPDLPTGAYRLTWSTLSSDDLHRTSGVLAFGVRTAVSGGGIEEASPDRVEAAAGAVLLGGMALLLGAPLALRTLRAAPPSARRRVRRAAVLGGWAAVGAAVVGPAREVLAGDATVLLAGGYAARWTMRTAGLVLLVEGIRTGGRRAVLVTGALLAAGGEALLGHAVAQNGDDPLRLPVTAVHLLAALGWTGAVAGIAIGLGRSWRRFPVSELRSDLRRFAVPAASGLAIAVATGFWLASDVVVSADAAVLTWYGRTLLLKLALVGGVCALALTNHRRLRDRRDLDLPRRSIRTEAILVGGLLTVTAVLLAGQPATEPQLAQTGPPPTDGPVARRVADLEEALSLRPNRAGPSTVLLDVFDRRRPALAPISLVTVRVGTVDLGTAAPLGDGHWSVRVPDLHEGPARVTVTVARPGTEPVTTTYRWVTGPASPTPAAVVSRTPLSQPLRLVAASTAALSAGIGVLLLRRRRRRALLLAVPAAGMPEEDTSTALT